MSYVAEFAESVQSTFRAPNNFCHDLQHVMRGAVKNLSQTCLLTDEPTQLARYQVVFTSLQNIIDTNTTMSECTVEQSDTFTMMESAADFLAASSTDASLAGQQRRTNISASSFKSSESTREVTFDTSAKLGADKLSAVLTPEMVEQLGEVYNSALMIEKTEAELKNLAPKVKKYTKHKQAEKLLAAQNAERALNAELAKAKGALQATLTTCFPEVYKRILREYIELCNSLLKATQAGKEILERGAMDTVGLTTAGVAVNREASAALTVDALEAYEALEEVKQGMQHHRQDSKTPEQKLLEKMELLNPPAPPATQDADKMKLALPLKSIPAVSSPSGHEASLPHPSSHSGVFGSPTKSAAASTAVPPLASQRDAQQTSHSGAYTDSLSAISVNATAPMAENKVQGDLNQLSPVPSSTTPQNGVEHAEESVAPSLAGDAHAKFPFWFRYYYFDRLVNSTERLAIAFGLYVSYCKRLARKASFPIPLSIKKHMDRIEMEFTTARYARHKREFQAVLKEIFAYRKNLEVMETYVRQAREAEAHMSKHAEKKNKKAYGKWKARLTEANELIENLRVEVFGRGAEDMVQFYDQLLQCIQGSMNDLIITLGGSPV